MSKTLRSEILELEQIIEEKKKLLFLERIMTIGDTDLKSGNISNVEINLDIDEEIWQIKYTHKTSKYNPSDYANSASSDEDSDSDSKVDSKDSKDSKESKDSPTYKTKESTISFGKSKKYYIKGGIQLNVYRNTAGELRVINPDYEFDLDLEEQRLLVSGYAENHNLPEWLAIKVFLYLSDNKWDNKALISHLSSV